MARGRKATSPTDIPAKGMKDVAMRVKDELEDDHIGLIAAGVAFYGLLALFPAISALLAIGGLVVEPSQIVAQMSALDGVIPAEVQTIVERQATAVAGSQEAGLGLAALVGILLALYSASKGMQSLMEGMNVAYDEDEDRGFFVKTAVKLGLTLLLIFGLLVSLGAIIAVPAALGVLQLGPVVEWLGTAAVWLVLLGLTVFGLAMLYRYGPSREDAEFKWVTPGAVIATVMWVTGSAAFAFYVGNFASYNESFGTLAGVVVLLMWFWISAYIVLLGAEVNSEIEAQTRHDTTTGAARPMGERGAVKADELGARA
ncbi:MAG: YihY/virulence factor BrkB family protein [Shimia sp.]